MLDKEKEMLCSENFSHLAHIFQEDLFVGPNSHTVIPFQGIGGFSNR